MKDVAGGLLEVQTFGSRICSDEDADGVEGVVEGGGDVVAAALVEIAEEIEQRIRSLEMVEQAPLEVVERGLIFGEDDEALVSFPGAVGIAEMGFNPPDEGGDAGITGGHAEAGMGVEPEGGKRRL